MQNYQSPSYVAKDWRNWKELKAKENFRSFRYSANLDISKNYI